MFRSAQTKRNQAASLLAALAALGVASTASAQSSSTTTPTSTVILNTALSLGYKAPNGTMPVKHRDGAGVMDTTVAFDRATDDIFAFWTNSQPWGGTTGLNTGMQAAMAITKLGPTGLATPTVKMLPLQGYNGEERVFMRPNALLGKDFVAVVFADENNGVDDGNPQSVVWVYDRSGNQLNITNANSVGQNPTDPVNLISLSGDNDGQQQCPHSACQLPDEADGSQSWIMGQQYNNQEARVMKVNFKTDGAGGVAVTVPYITTVVQNAQHNRVQLACDPATGRVQGGYVVATSVEADEQPANYGVRAVLVNVADGSVAASTRIAQSDNINQVYAVQPTAQYISPTMVAIEYQQAAAVRFGPNDGNGHQASPNMANLVTLQIPSPGGEFKVIQSMQRVAAQSRHAEAFPLLYGADGAQMPAIATISGSSIGTGYAMMQVLPIKTDGTFDAPDSLKQYQVAEYSDVSGLPAQAKKDPDQARGFIHGYSGLPNPSYRVSTGFMPEVKTFSISAVPGYTNLNTDNRESLTFALVPATWDPNVATVPGSATANVPPGPSPVAPVGTPVTNPTQPSPGSSTPPTTTGSSSGGTSSGGTSSGATSSGSNGVKGGGFGSLGNSASGCGCTTAGSDSTSGFAAFATLALGMAIAGMRRRTKKES